MQRGKQVRLSVPAFAGLVALALLVAPFWPGVFPVVVIAASLGTCAFVLLRRPSRALRLVLALVAVWLVVGHAGAWLLRGRPLAGFTWVITVLYVLPLPVIPWLYWRTFSGTEPPYATNAGAAGSGLTEDLPEPGPRTPDPESRRQS